MTTKEPHEMSEAERIDAAMAGLDQSPPPQAPPSTASAAAGLDPQDLVASPTLAALEVRRRPKEKTVCETCPNSVWFTSPVEVKCYCRVMYLITWSTQEPNQLTGCDGLYLGQAQE
jgi:hypothetical protein